MKYIKPVYILIGLFITSFAIIGLLAFISNKALKKENGFNRQILAPTLISQKQITLPVTVSKLIGMYSGRLYFQENNPYEIISTNISLDSLKAIKLPIPPDKDPGHSIQMFLKDQLLYIACGNVPGIITYDIKSGNSYSHILKTNFNQETLISKDQFILRSKDIATQSHRFVKLNLNAKDSLMEDRFSDRKVIGGFENAGILYYDNATRQACYTYFYQNGFICMDSNLNLTLKARTLDTITHRNVKVARVGKSITMNQPAQKVSYNGSVSDGKLFLQSVLKADNEHELDFNENSIIDIYSLKNGNYKGSFYIPAYKGEKAHQFQVIGHQLYALHGKTVLLYDMKTIADLL
jgi:hypothetical protein